MANLGRKGDYFVARFRYQGKEFKKSLRTTNPTDARAAMHSVEQVLHRLATGQIQIPPGVDPGDFILSGGTLQAARRSRAPSLNTLVQDYLASQAHKAASTVYTEGVHLRNLLRHFGDRSQRSVDQMVHRDLEQFLQARLKKRSAATVHKERSTIVQFFDWAVANGVLALSPATRLSSIKGDVERPPFRTVSQIETILARGGLSTTEDLDLWECLYLNPVEIAALLGLVRERAKADFTHLLHVIPAYTGMRRGEVLRLRWTDIEFDEGHIVARSRKQSRQVAETIRRIDLHPELERELRSWQSRRPRGQFVVGPADDIEPLGPRASYRAFWQPMRGTTWCLDSSRNWFKIGFHTYRHSFASNLAAGGVDQRIIDEWMGHQTEAMRKRYRHLFPKARRAAIESFSLAGTADLAIEVSTVEPGQPAREAEK